MSFWQHVTYRLMPDGPAPPARRRTVDEALITIRDVLETHDGDGSTSPELRVALQTLCDRAHRDDMPPERVLVRLKETMDVVPAFSAHNALGGEARGRIITFTIDLYFAVSRLPE